MNDPGRPGRLLRSLLPVCLLSMAASSPVFAQFNARMDAILAQEKLTMGAASFILLTGAGLLDDSSGLEEAALAFSDRFPDLARAWDSEIRLGDYSLFLMRLNRMRGGLVYRFLPRSRYALRELRFLDIVQGQSFVGMTLSGERALRIMGRFLAWKESER